MKTNFQNFVNLFALIFIALFALTLTSCGDDEEMAPAPPTPVAGCTDPLSENYNPAATIDNGTCIYERDKFIGTFNVVNDDCVGGSYPLNITPSAQGMDKIIIGNIQGLSNITLIGVVNGNSFTTEEKTFGDQTITNGNGIISGDVLNFTFQVNDDGYIFSCSINANRG